MSHNKVFNTSGNSAVLPHTKKSFHPPNNPSELQVEGTFTKLVFLVFKNYLNLSLVPLFLLINIFFLVLP